jgi:hypothetical protein
MGCRNVTRISVPAGYDFIPLLDAFKKYDYFADHHKYRNNYDYNLAICILNNRFYMTSGSILLTEDKSLFSPISQLNYEYYENEGNPERELLGSPDLQCLIGRAHTPFGKAQSPSIKEYADGVDTCEFLKLL